MKTFIRRGGHVGAIGETIRGAVYASYYLQDDVGVGVTDNFRVIEWNH